MKRAIVTPAVLPPSALAELKQWLGITTAHDDALLIDLLRAALETCEAFTGAIPLEATCEETWAASGAWRTLSARPVQAIAGIDALAASGLRTPLASDAYELELDPGGTGLFRVARSISTSRVVVRFTAGLASDWDALPDALRHGIMRLAAHQHREREDAGASPLPPASVAALWRPWRRMRLT